MENEKHFIEVTGDWYKIGFKFGLGLWMSLLLPVLFAVAINIFVKGLTLL